MFTIYHSNDVSVLKSLVMALMEREPLSSPFAKETVLVQSPGMSQWLRLEMAEHFGIAANIDFPLPATFVWNIFKDVLDGVPKQSAYAKEQMTWRLLQIIPLYLDQTGFEQLKQYLANDASQIKAFQLAAKIADIFDQYLMYRPDWINQWEQGSFVDALSGEDYWQAVLWRALTEATQQTGVSNYHRANLYSECIEALNSGYCPDSIKSLKRIFIFGISALPPRYLDVLCALGQHIEVHFMLANPCQYYWGDIQDKKYLAKMANQARTNFYSGNTKNVLKAMPTQYESGAIGNSLLASWGKVGRDMQRLLTNLPVQEVEAFVDPIVHHDGLNHDGLNHTPTLLSWLKSDMLVLKDRETTEKQVISNQDDSFQLRVCHSPMREVEVLHDHLLHLMQANPELQPRDIVVMVSDIDAYSPYINAVFSSQTDQQRIPFSISDLSSNQYHSIIQAYVWLLSLSEHRFTASEVIAFIQVPAVMRCFGFNESDFDVLIHWIEEAGIRWGLDQSTSESFDLPPVHSNTWLFGLERMLAGYAVSETQGRVGDVLPYEQVQGMNAALAGQLARLVQKLLHYRNQSNLDCSGSERVEEAPSDNEKRLSVAQWKQRLEQMRDDFFEVETQEESRQLGQISHTISRWYQQLSEAYRFESHPIKANDITLSSEVVFEVFSEALIQERISQRFLAGQLNFCTLMPMRSVPFKVVCLLGMDGNAYPRQQLPLGFDLMHGRFEYGDRSRRDDDRFLFLEALLSADSHFYVSYTGRSIRDNTEIIPSILISELLDYCSERFVLEGMESEGVDDNDDVQQKRLLSHLVHHHLMTPYSPQAFLDAKRPSFAGNWHQIAARINQTNELSPNFIQQPLPTYEFNGALDLAELKRFWEHPSRYFFSKRLKVLLTDADESIEEDEPFALNGLSRYFIKSELCHHQLALNQMVADDLGSVPIDVSKQFHAAGVLPVNAFGDIELEQNWSLIAGLTQYLSKLGPLDQKARTEITSDFILEETHQPLRLEGWLACHVSKVNDVSKTNDVASEEIDLSRATPYIQHRVGQVRTKDVFTLWIDHLALCLNGFNQSSQFVGLNSKSNQVEHRGFEPVSAEFAHSQLQSLITYWHQGMHFPLWFSLDLAQYYVTLQNNPKLEPEQIEPAMKDKLIEGLGEDEYLGRCWTELEDQAYDDFVRLTEHVYQPMIERLVTFNDAGAVEPKSEKKGRS